MKQHLSPEQVLSLTPEAQQRLREWWKPCEGDAMLFKDEVCYFGKMNDEGRIRPIGYRNWVLRKEEVLPLLSVGQCVELLTKQYFSRRLTWMERVAARVDGFTELQAVWRVGAPSYHKQAADLIDALFVAVKAVLEVQP
jgi:hypothetical protein